MGEITKEELLSDGFMFIMVVFDFLGVEEGRLDFEWKEDVFLRRVDF